jgi:hypothetical protein
MRCSSFSIVIVHDFLNQLLQFQSSSFESGFLCLPKYVIPADEKKAEIFTRVSTKDADSDRTMAIPSLPPQVRAKPLFWAPKVGYMAKRRDIPPFVIQKRGGKRPIALPFTST